MNGLKTMKLENVVAARKDNGRNWPFLDLSGNETFLQHGYRSRDITLPPSGH